MIFYYYNIYLYNFQGSFIKIYFLFRGTVNIFHKVENGLLLRNCRFNPKRLLPSNFASLCHTCQLTLRQTQRESKGKFSRYLRDTASNIRIRVPGLPLRQPASSPHVAAFFFIPAASGFRVPSPAAPKISTICSKFL